MPINIGIAGPYVKGIITKWNHHECTDAYGGTAPAGSFAPNSFGLNDMIGNVGEWVEDCWNATYAGAPADGGAWTSGTCGRRVLRGGAWNSKMKRARSASRIWNDANDRNSSAGFRVARALGPSEHQARLEKKDAPAHRAVVTARPPAPRATPAKTALATPTNRTTSRARFDGAWSGRVDCNERKFQIKLPLVTVRGGRLIGRNTPSPGRGSYQFEGKFDAQGRVAFKGTIAHKRGGRGTIWIKARGKGDRIEGRGALDWIARNGRKRRWDDCVIVLTRK